MNYITAAGRIPSTPRYVASYSNNRFGRTVSITDNFPHLDGGTRTMPEVIVVKRLATDAKVVPALAAAGFKLAGKWKTRADRSSCAIVERG
ncbi:hypothetical protein [Streptomyces sp. NBC_01751]|uniref:hypothetical protein n=1 Tax=Streptomyces sp. NBC_01751 TaxID=2975929 RepID=UPI002DD7D30E|nr:hypothetical protein [Streptomyces sp. NBC_01751]WSD23365.1 hypothetical protein OHA26_07675 [Streptomyces sp. NBC_01751]